MTPRTLFIASSSVASIMSTQQAKATHLAQQTAAHDLASTLEGLREVAQFDRAVNRRVG